MDKEKRRIPLYFINNFLKFDRKIYQIFGLKLGRPIPLKGVLYAISLGLIEVIWYFTPVFGEFIKWVPVGILMVIPITLAWLLTDIGTEGRLPVAFFRSLALYHMRKLKSVTYVRGKEIQKETSLQFHGHFTYGMKKEALKEKRYGYKGFVTFK
ncbi:TcpE family conjugal transfer membrane protein [Oceanobacillus damuensis]|uniref:TcpE family conjugal transfer membrane protein n=1 Tax=Oceanobacillus damuensis TaxID=937928 RepID=UPI000833ABF7|nr:TcpE family conjugal transfer membrane protein [Oceanobacillus damuensis]